MIIWQEQYRDVVILISLFFGLVGFTDWVFRLIDMMFYKKEQFSGDKK